MRRVWRIVIVVAFIMPVMGWSGAASSAFIPSSLRGIVISSVVRTENTGIFGYRYRVFNPPANDGQVADIQIEIGRGSGEVELSREGLTNGPRYFRYSSEDAFQQVPMVPVGISGPDGWEYGLGFDARTPPRGFAGWGAIEDPALIRPGTGLTGFELVSQGLPGIRNAEAVSYTHLTLPTICSV